MKTPTARSPFTLPGLLLGALPLGPLGAQTGEWDPGYFGPGLGGRVFALAEYRGELYAGGKTFRTDRLIQNVARFDGAEWQPLGAGLGGLGTTTAQRHVRALAVYNGELIAAGAFTTAGGQSANSIASWDGTRWAPLGLGVQRDNGLFATVHAMAVYNGELWVGGDFTVAGGQAMPALARWDGTTWRPGGTFLPDVLGNREVHGLEAIQTVLYAGGAFSAPGSNVARFDGTSWSPLGSGTDSTVRAFALFRGEVIAGGGFYNAGGISAPGVAAWNGTSWRSLGSISPNGVNPVYGVESFQDRLYVTGRLGDSTRNILHVARWNGTGWEGIGGIQGVVSGTLLTTGLCLHARANDIVLGGEFEYATDVHPTGPAVASRNVAAFDGQTWLAIGEGGQGFSDEIRQLVEYDGGFVAVGPFETAGTAVARGLAFFDGDGWSELGRFGGGAVGMATAFNGDLYVTGRFTSVNGQPILRSARWDGSQWSAWGNGANGPLVAYQGRLHQGLGNGLYVWNGGTRSLLAQVPGEIDHLHVHQGALYVSVYNVFQPTVHRWDGASLTQVATVDSYVEMLGSFGPELVVGGGFSTIGGVPALRIARYDGNTWRPFGSGLGNGLYGTAVHAIGELDGTLYAGGNFGGGIYRWDGAIWQAMGTGISGTAFSILPDPADGSLLIGGSFYEAGGLVADHLARWQTAPAWRDLLHGTPGTGGIPLFSGRGSLVAGSTLGLSLDRAAAFAPCAVVLGGTRIDRPFFGGVLVPAPDVALVLLTGGTGSFALRGTIPAGLYPGDLLLQTLVLDAAAPAGVAFSNALRASLP